MWAQLCVYVQLEEPRSMYALVVHVYVRTRYVWRYLDAYTAACASAGVYRRNDETNELPRVYVMRDARCVITARRRVAAEH